MCLRSNFGVALRAQPIALRQSRSRDCFAGRERWPACNDGTVRAGEAAEGVVPTVLRVVEGRLLRPVSGRVVDMAEVCDWRARRDVGGGEVREAVQVVTRVRRIDTV